jgi:hypothetical protein
VSLRSYPIKVNAGESHIGVAGGRVAQVNAAESHIGVPQTSLLVWDYRAYTPAVPDTSITIGIFPLPASNPSFPTATITYSHTCYPAHQLKINGKNPPIYHYPPGSNEPDYIFQCLFMKWPMVQNQIGPIAITP